MTFRPPYSGPTRKLVLAFDVGTTFSGISYCILDPGAVPEICAVTRFPGQEAIGGDSKIPTIVIYDKQGQLQAAGAEALDPRFEDNDEDPDHWVKAEWFKLHLRPKTKSAAHVMHDIPLLPKGKTAIDVFVDFLRYLIKCAKIYIEETYVNGDTMWRSLQPNAEFVLTHPNGWEGAQQSMMRKAAVMAGLVPDTEHGRSRLTFVTEAKPACTFASRKDRPMRLSSRFQQGIIIVDAGEVLSTSVLTRKRPKSESFEEVAPPECYFNGSIFVTSNGRFLEVFKNSRFLEDVPRIASCFDKTTKLRFRNAEEDQYTKFGALRDRDPSVSIRSGQIKLTGADVASFFEPSVQCILKSVDGQLKAAKNEISSIFLVGGFGASNWLFSEMKKKFSPMGLDIRRPDTHVNKAVADGAISFHIDHLVSGRISKFAHGINMITNYDPLNPEHAVRKDTAFRDITGSMVIGGLFDVILPKGAKVTETQEFRKSYCQNASDARSLSIISAPIVCYRGKVEMKICGAHFVDKDPNMYSPLCSVEGDLSRVPKSPRMSSSGKKYYRAHIDVVLSLGLTETKAQVCWMENGVEKR
ncbi:hypothetical protein BJ912DRAFT_1098484 [Pholiota molesta]|nr:hypothetical protein BJ912DRAFT_1098484 [Pholiota molesta]